MTRPLHGELMACHEGLRAAGEKGIIKVVIETDSVLVKLSLESNSSTLSPTGGIVFNIKSMLNMYFVSCSENVRAAPMCIPRRC